MSTITLARSKVKPARRTARPATPFGSGLFRFVPFAVTAGGFIEPSDEDRAAVGLMFADDGPDYDAMAEEAAYLDWCAGMTPPPVGPCSSCGEYAEALSWGMCPDCFDDAACDAAIAGQNERAGLGYRVF